MIVCVGLVITGVLSVGDAFSGFINTNVIMFVAIVYMVFVGPKLLPDIDNNKFNDNDVSVLLKESFL